MRALFISAHHSFASTSMSIGTYCSRLNAGGNCNRAGKSGSGKIKPLPIQNIKIDRSSVVIRALSSRNRTYIEIVDAINEVSFGIASNAGLRAPSGFTRSASGTIPLPKCRIIRHNFSPCSLLIAFPS